MDSSMNSQSSSISPLYISAIGKPKVSYYLHNQRYGPQQRQILLLNAQQSASEFKHRNKRPQRAPSQSVLGYLKINSNIQFSSSNIALHNKHQIKLKKLPSKIITNRQKIRATSFDYPKANDQQKISIKQGKLQLFNGLIDNYQRKNSMLKPKHQMFQPNQYFATQIPTTISVPRNSMAKDYNKYSLLKKEYFQTRNHNVQQLKSNEYEFDQNKVKKIVHQQVCGNFNLKIGKSLILDELNLLGFHQKSRYEKKMKNVKLLIVKK